MWDRYSWVAVTAFGLCVIAAVASYLWDPSFTWWPILSILIGTAFMFPLVAVRPLLAILAVQGRSSVEVATGSAATRPDLPR